VTFIDLIYHLTKRRSQPLAGLTIRFQMISILNFAPKLALVCGG
jgi:hypothetical protein